MTPTGLWGGRLALWWAGVYTSNAPEPDATDRRAELRADLFDHLASARDPGRVSRSMAGRTLRGMHHDVAWRLQVERRPGRAQWHVQHPGTVLASLFALLLPLALVTDTGLSGDGAVVGPRAVAAALLMLLCATTIGFAVVAAAHQALRPGEHRPSDVSLLTVRRWILNVMSVTWAVAGIWRFAPSSLELVASAAWACFGIALLAYLGAVLAGTLARLLDVRKVSS